jgi:hypothetical protein
MSRWCRSSARVLMSMLIVQASYAFDVHGIHIGDRWDSDKLEEAMSYVTVPSAQRVKCRDNADETCTGTTRYLAADVRMIIEGKNGRVRKITMTLPTADFDDEITALKREFGQPTSEWSAPAGAAPLLFHHRVDWRLPSEELFGLKFSAMATLGLTTPEESLAERYPPPN